MGRNQKTPRGKKKPPTEPGSGRAAICLDRLGGSGNEGGEGQQEKLGWGWRVVRPAAADPGTGTCSSSSGDIRGENKHWTQDLEGNTELVICNGDT